MQYLCKKQIRFIKRAVYTGKKVIVDDLEICKKRASHYWPGSMNAIKNRCVAPLCCLFNRVPVHCCDATAKIEIAPVV
jgi:hypothetical protein